LYFTEQTNLYNIHFKRK